MSDPGGRDPDSLPDPESFLSGERGNVIGRRERLVRRAGDLALGLRQHLAGTGRELDDLARQLPRRRVLVLSAYRPHASAAIAAAAAELRRSRHELRLALASVGEAHPELGAETVASGLSGGKFQNLNAALAAGGSPGDFDWTLVIDDDVQLPPRFLDRLIAVCEHFDLALAQPAQTLASHAAWRITRRRAGSLLRETRFVEIGPVTAFRRDVAGELMPFPDLRYGWGLDLHWAAVASERGWRMGVVDAVAVRHERAPIALAYPAAEAVDEGRRFLATRPYLRSALARETLVTHRRIAGRGGSRR